MLHWGIHRDGRVRLIPSVPPPLYTRDYSCSSRSAWTTLYLRFVKAIMLSMGKTIMEE